jgi:hypothetical protein
MFRRIRRALVGALAGRIGATHADTSTASVAHTIATIRVGSLNDRDPRGLWNMFGFSTTERFRIESPLCGANDAIFYAVNRPLPAIVISNSRHNA